MTYNLDAIEKELEKNGIFNIGMYVKGLRAFGTTNTAKYIKQISKAIRQGGLSKGLRTMAKHQDPLHVLKAGKIGKGPVGMTGRSRLPTMARGVRTSLGNLSQNLLTLGKGVPQSGIFAPLTVAKNFGTLATRQMRGAMYKTVGRTARPTTGQMKGIKKYFRSGVVKHKGQLYHKGWFLPKRKILGTTSTGDFIVKKRKGILPLSLAMTGPGFGAISYATADKSKSSTERAVGALGEAGAWTVAPQIATAKLLYDTVKGN